MEYWLEEPPTHVILALRYLGQRRPLNEDQARAQIAEAGQLMGQPAMPLPPDLREVMQWGDSLTAKLSKGKGKNGRKL